MFEHSRILNENKLNRVAKWFAKSNMDTVYFIENHFIPSFIDNSSKDLPSFLTSLEKSFDYLVEAKVVKMENVNEKAKQQIKDAMLNYLAKGGVVELLKNIHIPNVTIEKSTLIKKLGNDLINFLMTYNFPSAGELPSDLETKIIKKQSFDRTFNNLLGYKGSITDDIKNWKVQNIRMWYDDLEKLSKSKFNATQKKYLVNNNYNQDEIVKTAKKLIDKLLGLTRDKERKYAPEFLGKQVASPVPASSKPGEISHNPKKLAVKENYLERIKSMEDYLNKMKVTKKEELINPNLMRQHAKVLRSKLGQWRLAHEIEELADKIKPSANPPETPKNKTTANLPVTPGTENDKPIPPRLGIEDENGITL